MFSLAVAEDSTVEACFSFRSGLPRPKTGSTRRRSPGWKGSVANEIAKVSPGPEKRTKWNIKPEQAVWEAKHLEVNSSKRNLGEVLPSRFVRPELTLVTVAADFLKNSGKGAAFLAFIRGRQFPDRLGD